MDTSEQDRLVDALGHAAFTTMGALTDLAADAGLSLTQLRVLAILRDRRLRIGDLAEYLGLEKSTMTGLVARASQKGLLAREPNPDDARAVDVVLTDRGHEVALALESAMRDALLPLTERLPPADRRRLRELLERMLR
ncbi:MULTISPECIES: MarR family winged helix-turn-helix transcriptional regulator [unclassified Curtobacterium]|uniref:MarR family winged helix-turn-helix transcriptional regulator n=1 Tax=unclassified Curtobacterium TaxID=257496 RepID=UPI000F4CB7F2|nr:MULTISPECIES: MarR family transcriptional regulator [unclassified Curtobacterium]ROP63834.1 DNA-binding MarR family transcriptional regulator [Curtobacterium sp. ZW137]TCK65636.1 DNA-binding MarR family transcriptional regulator [Curtobacterium sp. PhB136]